MNIKESRLIRYLRKEPKPKTWLTRKLRINETMLEGYLNGKDADYFHTDTIDQTVSLTESGMKQWKTAVLVETAYAMIYVVFFLILLLPFLLNL